MPFSPAEAIAPLDPAGPSQDMGNDPTVYKLTHPTPFNAREGGEGFSAGFDAAFPLTGVGKWRDQLRNQPNFPAVTGYSAYNGNSLAGYEDAADAFATSKSPQETDYIKKQIDKDRFLTARVNMGGNGVALGSAVGAILDPANFAAAIPGLGEISVGGRVTTALARAAAAGGVSAVVEGGEQLSRMLGTPTTPRGEAADAIFGQVAFNAFFAGTAGLFKAGEAGAAVGRVDPLPGDLERGIKGTLYTPESYAAYDTWKVEQRTMPGLMKQQAALVDELGPLRAEHTTMAAGTPEADALKAKIDQNIAVHAALVQQADEIAARPRPAMTRMEPAATEAPDNAGKQGAKAAGADKTPNRDEIFPEWGSQPEIAPGNVTYDQAQRMHGEAMQKAFGLERLQVNPILAMLNSPSETIRDLVGRLVTISGFQNKNSARMGFKATTKSVWQDHGMMEGQRAMALKETDALYLAHIKRLAREAGIADPTLNVATRLKQRNFGGHGMPSQADFFQEVGDAKSVLGLQTDGRVFSPEAKQAAQIWEQRVYKPIADMAHEHGAFVYGPTRELEAAQAHLAAARANANRVGELAGLRARVEQLKDAIKELKTTSLHRPDYLNRIWNHEVVKGRRDELAAIIQQYTGMDRDAAQSAINTIIDGSPFKPIGPDAIGRSSALHERSLSAVPDSAIRDFIERDISVTGAAYTRTTGVDALLAREFNGEIDLKTHIEDVVDEYKKLATGQRGANLTAINKQMATDLENLRGIRDQVRGTYGLSKDPQGYLSRGIRIAHGFNQITQLTGFISALPDVARLLFHEGLERSFGPLLDVMTGKFGAYKLSQREAQLAGTATDVVFGFRAATMGNAADAFSTSTRVERWLQHAVSMQPMLDGMNHFQELVKTIQSVVSGTRIIEGVRQLAAGTASDLTKMKLAREHIDYSMARRIARQLDGEGELPGHAMQHDHAWIANTELWSDEVARDHFRAALAKAVDTSIVSGASPGEKPLWMSTQLGGLLSQYKSYGFGAVQRILLPGLQAPDRNFLLGSAAMVGMGALTDFLQTHARGEDYGSKNAAAKFTGALDHSGVLGYIMDVDNAVEGASQNMLGLRPWIGATPFGQGSLRGQAGAVGGPTVSSALDLLTSVTGNQASPMTRSAQLRVLPYFRAWQLHELLNMVAGSQSDGTTTQSLGPVGGGEE